MKKAILTLTAAALAVALLGLFGCGGAKPAAQEAAATEAPVAEQSAAPAEETPEAEATPTPATQSGELDIVLFDAAQLYAKATAFRFTPGGTIEIDVHAYNDNNYRGTVWCTFSEINGWYVQNQQSTTVVALQPGEELDETVVFDLTGTMAQYLYIDALRSLTLSVEGYLDSYDYEYQMNESVIDLPDTGEGEEQVYAENFEVLLDNEYLTVAYCGVDESTGAKILYYEVKQASEGTEEDGAYCKLYPAENGVYDTERYLALDKQDMKTVTKRLISFTPAMGGEADAAISLFAVATGVPMAPAELTLPAENAVPTDLSAMPVLAEDDTLRIRYDAQNRRFYAENLTENRTLQLDSDKSFALDGKEITQGAQSVLCFPGTATAFRISGHAPDEKGVERNTTIGADSKTISIQWKVSEVLDGIQKPDSVGKIAAKDASLAG